MDASTSHPLDKPIAWNESMLAKQDAVMGHSELPTVNAEPHAEPLEEPLEGASITEPLAYGEAPTILPIDKRFMKPVHESNMIFEHWTDGKKPLATTSEAVNIGSHVCDIEGCDKAFVRKGDLSRHLKSHKSGPRTHDCLADKCPRKQMKGFWRMDKLKDHMARKHPEIEIERWYNYWTNERGYRDVEKRAQHEVLMRSKGFKAFTPGYTRFWRMSPAENAAV
ncbi:MAG: hypothetical protein Q9176_005774 [Flavoplaca citrina]